MDANKDMMACGKAATVLLTCARDLIDAIRKAGYPNGSASATKEQWDAIDRRIESSVELLLEAADAADAADAAMPREIVDFANRTPLGLVPPAVPAPPPVPDVDSVWVLASNRLLRTHSEKRLGTDDIGGIGRAYLSKESALDDLREFLRPLVNEAHDEDVWRTATRTVDDVLDEVIATGTDDTWSYNGTEQSFVVTLHNLRLRDKFGRESGKAGAR